MVGGVLVDRPVSGARVHICEVDPFWLILRKLPEYYVFKLRDDLVELLKNPPLPRPARDADGAALTAAADPCGHGRFCPSRTVRPVA